MPPKYTLLCCSFDSNEVAILAVPCNQCTEGNRQPIRVKIRCRDDLSQNLTKQRSAIETVCLFSVALEDHFDVTFLLNVQVVDSGRLLTGESAEDGGEGAHGVRVMNLGEL